MNAWIPKKLNYKADVVANGSQDYHFTVTAQGAKRFLVVLNASAVTGPISVVVKTAIGGLATSVLHSTTAVSAAGQTIVEVLPATGLPILSQGTITITAPAAKTITVDNLHVLQEE
jgi:hypothetical protein